MADVRVLKFDVGSSTDQALQRLQKRLDTGTGVEAMRRSLAIADTITRLSKEQNNKIFVQDENGNMKEILIP